MSEPVRVLYIMGSGRSGSTVLDTILGNHPCAASFGELGNLPRFAWTADEYCACGERGTACPFWSAVRRRWEEAGGELESYVALQSRFERLRSLPRLWLSGEAFASWKRQTEALYRALAAETGAAVLVDSSKSPARGYALSFVPGLDLFYLHLVRDGRGVAWSLLKPHAKDERAGVQHDIAGRSVGRTALRWSVINLLSSAVLRRQREDRRHLLRYEDYVADPVAELAPLRAFLGGEPDAFEAVLAAELSVGHTIAGNRLRMAGRVRLRPDVEWRERMSDRDRRRFWRIAGGVMRRFGYAK